MKRLLATLLLIAASTAVQSVEIASGAVACRTRAALEILRVSGGFDKMPEFYRGITCFQLARPLSGEFISRDKSGVVEIRLTQRRSFRDPDLIYLDEGAEITRSNTTG